MATIDIQKVENVYTGMLYLWEGLANGDVGSPLSLNGEQDVTFFVYGDDGGGTVTIQAAPLKDVPGQSNDFLPIDDAFGVAFAVTTEACKPLGPTVPFIRPVVAGGTAGDVDVYAFVTDTRKTRR